MSLCESRGGCTGLPGPNSSYGPVCGRNWSNTEEAEQGRHRRTHWRTWHQLVPLESGIVTRSGDCPECTLPLPLWQQLMYTAEQLWPWWQYIINVAHTKHCTVYTVFAHIVTQASPSSTPAESVLHLSCSRECITAINTTPSNWCRLSTKLNHNNGYLERLTRTGPKRLHIL